jgi:hypothetical protein
MKGSSYRSSSVAASGRPPFTSLGLVRVAVIGMAAARSQLPRRRTRTALSATQPSVQDPSGTAGAVTCARSNFPSLSTIAIEITGWRVFCVYPGAVAGKAHVANGDNVGAPVHRYRGGVLHAWWRQRRRGCVLRAACCVLRAACCVLRAACCCVLLLAAAGCSYCSQHALVLSLPGGDTSYSRHRNGSTTARQMKGGDYSAIPRRRGSVGGRGSGQQQPPVGMSAHSPSGWHGHADAARQGRTAALSGAAAAAHGGGNGGSGGATAAARRGSGAAEKRRGGERHQHVQGRSGGGGGGPVSSGMPPRPGTAGRRPGSGAQAEEGLEHFEGGSLTHEAICAAAHEEEPSRVYHLGVMMIMIGTPDWLRFHLRFFRCRCWYIPMVRSRYELTIRGARIGVMGAHLGTFGKIRQLDLSGNQVCPSGKTAAMLAISPASLTRGFWDHPHSTPLLYHDKNQRRNE